MWNRSTNKLFMRRSSSDNFHLSPLKTRHGFVIVPIFSFLKSFKLCSFLTPNSIISRIWSSYTRPITTLSGRFLEWDPNMNKWQLLLLTSVSRGIWSSNGVTSLFRVKFLQLGFLNVHKSFSSSLITADDLRPSKNNVFLAFSIVFGSRFNKYCLPLRVFGFLE